MFGTNHRKHKKVCCASLSITLTYNFRIDWPWLQTLHMWRPICDAYRSVRVLSISSWGFRCPCSMRLFECPSSVCALRCYSYSSLRISNISLKVDGIMQTTMKQMALRNGNAQPFFVQFCHDRLGSCVRGIMLPWLVQDLGYARNWQE